MSDFSVPLRDFWSINIPHIHDAALEPYVIAWVSLLGDSPCGLKPKKLVSAFLTDISTLLGYSKTARLYKGLFNAFVALLATDLRRIDSLSDGDYFGAFKGTPIFKEVIHALKTRDVRTITYVLTFLNLGKKTVYAETSELESAAFRGWLDVESRLGEFVLPSELKHDLRKIMEGIVRSYWPDYRLAFEHVVLPYHGSGRVSIRGVATPSDKDANLVLRKSFILACLADTNLNRFLPEAAKPSYAHIVARLKFVMKDIFKMRSICLEPPGIQWSQQSVRWSLERLIKGSVAGRFIRLEDQTWNSEAARAGSSLLHCDTIDLKDASDSVHADLVVGVFPACVNKWLQITRSKMVETPDGKVVTPLKFAPMGSALTFPIQSLLYLAIVLYACHRHIYGDAPVELHSFRELLTLITDDPWVERPWGLPAIRVYGDDIICPREVTPIVIATLEQLKFTVNRDKSFTGDMLYRESCGGHFVNGDDVTPFSFKPDATEGVLTGELLASIVNAANRALDFGYSTLRTNLLRFAHYRHHRHGGLLREARPLAYGDTHIRGPRPDFAPHGRYKYKYGHNAQTHPLIMRRSERVVELRIDTPEKELDPVRGLIGFYRRTKTTGHRDTAWYEYLPTGGIADPLEIAGKHDSYLAWTDVPVD